MSDWSIIADKVFFGGEGLSGSIFFVAVKPDRRCFFWFVFAGVFLTSLAVSNFFSNSLMLMMDRVNFIPEQSSIFSFEPYEINQGSSSYWIYGEDGENYYYFSYEPASPYMFIAKNNSCQGFDRKDFKTWCSAQNGVNN
ncbi:hypothetical protein K5D33_17370 [Pseudomonas cichorii]|uniref:hypothetical protein n=1 Tax=Pseudomonas lijiangensis TaxID=2995658 RepID=UPI001C88055E|nr:hypothetical protein [Pseudomonas cichorii]MBX8536469.1 hypothetical protein [Pseudomonas cichorii]